MKTRAKKRKKRLITRRQELRDFYLHFGIEFKNPEKYL